MMSNPLRRVFVRETGVPRYALILMALLLSSWVFGYFVL